MFVKSNGNVFVCSIHQEIQIWHLGATDLKDILWFDFLRMK